ncbi:MAG TPA: hypothetical protein VMP41_04175 [Acidimicrobiales bacterium]|nr:hypothetical protein [Acidimicrobiales bacterium]
MTDPRTDKTVRRAAMLGELGAALALLVAGLAMMVIPTLAFFTSLWKVTAPSLGFYVAALVAGAGTLVVGGILAGIVGQSVRRETMMAYQAEIAKTKRVNDLAERMSQVSNAVTQTRVDLLSQLSEMQDTLEHGDPPPPPDAAAKHAGPSKAAPEKHAARPPQTTA